jgi:hypothetical protein
MHNKGTAYVLQWENEFLPDFIGHLEEEFLEETAIPQPSSWETIFISGGRKDKISKGDIAGTFFRQAGLKKEELGIIELKNDCAFVAVAASRANYVVEKLDNIRLKKKKVRVRILE